MAWIPEKKIRKWPQLRLIKILHVDIYYMAAYYPLFYGFFKLTFLSWVRSLGLLKPYLVWSPMYLSATGKSLKIAIRISNKLHLLRACIQK